MIKNTFFIFLIVIIYNYTNLYPQMPPHPKLLDEIKDNKIAMPYTLLNLSKIKEKGIDAPWTSKELQEDKLLKKSILKDLGPKSAPSGNWKALIDFGSIYR